jgi:hypothetical protein
MTCGFRRPRDIPVWSPCFGLATRTAICLEHGVQFHQRIRIVLTPPACIADQGGKIGNADDMAILRSEI